jgi:threonine synthase
MNWGVLESYKEYLPVGDDTPMITLGEGNTPLVRSYRLAEEIGCPELYFKLEGCNPTGSFKDRGMVVAVAKALEEGSQGIICASTGNTSASAAAYGARVGVPATVLVPEGDIAFGKLAQAQAHGARILAIDGNFDKALSLVRIITERQPLTLVNSVNLLRLEGQKTAAFEIVDRLGDAPDLLCIPVGNAGNITSYWKGFREYQARGKAESLPRMMGFQAEGAAPLVEGRPISNPATVASAIRIGNPASWQGAINARDESGGTIDAVTDMEILDAYRLLSTGEGVFCEPASAASVAGLIKLHRQGMDLSDQRVVCVITGSGLKDPELAVRFISTGVKEVSSDLEEVEAALLEFAA